MTESRLIFKNVTALTLAKLAEKGATVCLSFVLARYLGASALGIYSAALVLLGLVSLVAEMGSTNFLVREVSRDQARTSVYLVHFSILAVLVSGCVIPAAWVILPHLGYSAELEASAYVVTFAAVPAVLRMIQEGVFVAHQRVEFITYSTLATSILNVCASLFFLHRGHGIVSVVMVFAVAQYVIVLGYFLLLNRYVYPLRWEFNPRRALQLIKQVRTFTGSSLLAALSARPEIIILSLLKSDAQIGFYSAALRIVDLWHVVPETYMRIVLPVLSRSHMEDRQRCKLVVDKSVKYLLAISLPLMTGTFVAAEPLVNWVYGPGFGPSVSAVRIMALCIPLTFLFEMFWRLLVARDEQHLMLRAQVIMTAVRLSGGFLLIGWLASLGAAINTSVILLGHNLLLGFYARRDGTQLDVCRLAWRLSLAALGMAVLVALLVNRSALWVVVLAAAASYSIMVVLFRGLTRDDFARFRRVWQVRTSG